VIPYILNSCKHISCSVPHLDSVNDVLCSIYLHIQQKIRGSAIVETVTFPTVRKSDAGNFTCSLISVGSASVALHVLSGKTIHSLSWNLSQLLVCYNK